ncbi:MAG TPA: HAD family hydrolase [Actinomycetota bacterium]
MRPAVFLDRDGTLVEEVSYLHEPDKVALVDGALPALRRLADARFALVVVSNQAGVARGYYRERDVEAVHGRLQALLAAGGVALDGIWYCPHHPDGTVAGYARACRCRKPGAGMLEAAAVALRLDLAASWLVGNNPSDVGAARAAGVAPLYVTTGRASGETPPPGVAAFPTLAAATAAILSQRVGGSAGERAAELRPGPPWP